METIQAELRDLNPELNIEIIGVNLIGRENSNPVATASRTLPWLQDNNQAAVWSRWNATWRDVRILDARNREVAVLNLFDNDLSSPANRDTLKQLFLQTAQVVDEAGDGLPDDWQWLHFGNLPANPHDDPDADGFDNLTEFLFGTDPLDPASVPSVQPRIVSNGQEKVFEIQFRRPAGDYLQYLIEFSTELREWTRSSSGLVLRNLYDGSGTVQATFTLPQAVDENPAAFLRVRVVRPDQSD